MGFSKHITGGSAAHAMTGAGDVFEIWRHVRAQLRAEYGDTIYASDIARLRVSEDADGAVRLICPNAYSRAWVEENIGDRIRAIWTMIEGAPREIRTGIDGADDAAPAPRPASHATLSSGVSAGALSGAHGGADEDGEPGRAPGREPRFTFDTFMIGHGNMIATTAARAIASTADAPFKLVFFHGAYGVGKTHLLRAVAHAVELSGGRSAVYLTAEEFLNGFQTALRQRDTAGFKQRVRECDVLLIDDVHFIAGKPRTEDEFLHTIAARVAEGRHVVLASHCEPNALKMEGGRMDSILASGFACQITPPDLDLRRKILDCKIAVARAHCPELEVPETVRDFLAARVTASARELEGVLNNIVVRTAYMNLPVTMETVQAALEELPIKAEKRVTVEDIQKAVAAHFKVTVEDLISKRRTQTIVRPRHIAMYLCKTMTTRSLPDIGRRFGKRDHSTVIHAVNKIAERLPSDAALADDVEAVKRRLRG